MGYWSIAVSSLFFTVCKLLKLLKLAIQYACGGTQGSDIAGQHEPITSIHSKRQFNRTYPSLWCYILRLDSTIELTLYVFKADK
jgi:hypothetical protein